MKMKGLLVTLGIAIAVVAGVVYVSTNAENNEKINVAADFNIDLSQNENLCDLVFDANGVLISNITYAWNAQSNTRGEILASGN